MNPALPAAFHSFAQDVHELLTMSYKSRRGAFAARCRQRDQASGRECSEGDYFTPAGALQVRRRLIFDLPTSERDYAPHL